MASSEKPACWLIVFNVSKKHNIGTLIRCATAFNVKEVCLVGSRQFNTFGSHGCEIIGVEITDSAKSVQSHPWSGPVAFMLGNEGQGLNDRQLSLCDSFVYIPQYGAGTASLNVAVAASIVLHHYAVWAEYPERSRHGYKFNVAERPQRTAGRGQVPYTEAELAELRAKRAAKAAAQREGAGDGEAAVLDVARAGVPE